MTDYKEIKDLLTMSRFLEKTPFEERQERLESVVKENLIISPQENELSEDWEDNPVLRRVMIESGKCILDPCRKNKYAGYMDRSIYGA